MGLVPGDGVLLLSHYDLQESLDSEAASATRFEKAYGRYLGTSRPPAGKTAQMRLCLMDLQQKSDATSAALATWGQHLLQWLRKLQMPEPQWLVDLDSRMP